MKDNLQDVIVSGKFRAPIMPIPARKPISPEMKKYSSTLLTLTKIGKQRGLTARDNIPRVYQDIITKVIDFFHFRRTQVQHHMNRISIKFMEKQKVVLLAQKRDQLTVNLGN